MKNIESYEKLIKDRQACTKCHQKDNLGQDNLRQFEKLLSENVYPSLLSPWCPVGENSLNAEILIVGQDFGIFQYLEEEKNMDGLKLKEEGNSTNEKLRDYLQKAGLLNANIYFTNSILCIKNGETKITKKGTSMSTPIKLKWCINCSETFLKPLITDHLINVKIIITLGKHALFSINHIADSLNNEIKPLIDLIAIKQCIHISNKPYTLIPMLHPSFDHLSVKGQKEAKKAKELWEDIKDKIYVN